MSRVHVICREIKARFPQLVVVFPYKLMNTMGVLSTYQSNHFVFVASIRTHHCHHLLLERKVS
jgi:hypothetical protein